MTRHPPVEELIEVAFDFIEEHGAASAERHVAECAVCRAQIDGMRAALERLREADVPEPPPLYWPAFRRQVARRLEEDARRPRRRTAWLWLPALAGAAALALAVVPRLDWRAPAPVTLAPAAAFVPAWTPLPEAGEDAGFMVLQALASTGGMGAVAECRDLGECLAGLPEDDARSLAQAFRAELQGGEL